MADRSRGRFAKKIQTVHWTYGSFEFSALSAGASAVNVLAAQHLPETLLRFRGEWIATFASAGIPNRAVAVSIGLILVPEGTASTVLWSPITDGDAPWIWWDTFHLSYQEMVVDVIGTQIAMGGRRVIDSKAMRKSKNMELQAVAEQATILSASGADVDVAGSLRVLAGS